MKKITFLLFILVTATFFGQVKLTSSIGEYFDGTEWRKSYKTEFEYDENNKISNEIEFNWDNSTFNWIKSFEIRYEYFDDYFVEYTDDYYEGVLTTQERTAYYFNANGKVDNFKSWEYDGGNWIPTSDFVITYVDGIISSAIRKEWDGGQSKYIFGDESSSITLTYNGNGKVSMSKSDSWDGANWVDAERTVYTYDANDRIIVEDSQTWNGVNWLTDYKSEYTYDANGNAITEKDSYLDEDDVLIAGELETITFDTSSLMSNYSHPYKDKTGFDYIFSANGIINKILQRSSTNNRTTYNYDDATANVNEFSLVNFEVYPNPATSVLNIDDSNFSIKIIEIYNVLGKKVITSNKNQLSLENLVNGVYLIKVEDDKGNIATKRLLKN